MSLSQWQIIRARIHCLELAKDWRWSKTLFKGVDNVSSESFDDLLVDYMRAKQARFVIRGLRAVSDFEYEFQMASANHRLDGNVETIFLTPSESNYFYFIVFGP